MEYDSADVEIEEFPLINTATGAATLAHILVSCDFEKWSSWEIFDIRINVGTPMNPKFEPINDPDTVAYLKARLAASAVFQRLADEVHAELFSPEAEYEAYVDRQIDDARVW